MFRPEHSIVRNVTLLATRCSSKPLVEKGCGAWEPFHPRGTQLQEPDVMTVLQLTGLDQILHAYRTLPRPRPAVLNSSLRDPGR